MISARAAAVPSPRAVSLIGLALLALTGCAKTGEEWRADLSAPEPYARVMAAVALGRIGDAGAVPALVEALDDGSESVRGAARDALHDLGAPAVAALLEALRRDGGAGLAARERALATLPALGEVAVPPLVDALAGGQHDEAALASVLGQLGAHAARALAPLLASNDAQLVLRAAGALAAAGPAGREAVPELVQAATRGEPAVRAAAALALREVAPADPRAIATLLGGAHDEDPEVRDAMLLGAVAGLLKQQQAGGAAGRDAATRLAALGTDAVPALCAILREPAEDPVAPAVRALAALGPAVLPAVLGQLNGRNIIHAGRVERLVTRLGPDALPVLLELLAGPDGGPRVLAATAIGALGEAASPAVPALLAVLDEPQTSLARQGAAYSVGRLVPAEAASLDRLLAVLAREDRFIAAFLLPAAVRGLLQQLARPTGDNAARERRAAQLDALAPGSLPLLRIAAKGPNAALAEQARLALARADQRAAEAGAPAGTDAGPPAR